MFVKEELMNGDDQYYCTNCEKKTDAKRYTQISSLPPVLNLQLLRFLYDRTTGRKKKLSTKIKYVHGWLRQLNWLFIICDVCSLTLEDSRKSWI